MRSALIDNSTNIVTNVIMADPSVDPTPDGYTMIALPDNSPVSIGWIYNSETGDFTDPNPPPVVIANPQSVPE